MIEVSSSERPQFDFDGETRAELEADVRVFEQIALAKAQFYDDVVAKATPVSAIEPRELRSENVYSLAEFYYLLRMFGIDSPHALRGFAEVHTEKIEGLLEERSEQERLGINAQRLADSGFGTPAKLDRLEANCGADSIRLSQSDLARFMVEYMSPETCRNTVKVLCDPGYLTVTKSPFGAVLVTSTGALERIFAEQIRCLRESLGVPA